LGSSTIVNGRPRLWIRSAIATVSLLSSDGFEKLAWIVSWCPLIDPQDDNVLFAVLLAGVVKLVVVLDAAGK